jgi:hypothetical protein
MPYISVFDFNKKPLFVKTNQDEININKQYLKNINPQELSIIHNNIFNELLNTKITDKVYCEKMVLYLCINSVVKNKELKLIDIPI